MRRLSPASPGPENITLNCHDVNTCLSSRLSTVEGELAEREREEAGATVHVGKSKLTREGGGDAQSGNHSRPAACVIKHAQH